LLQPCNNQKCVIVAYAKQNSTRHDDFDAPGLGFVDKILAHRQAVAETPERSQYNKASRNENA